MISENCLRGLCERVVMFVGKVRVRGVSKSQR